MTNKESFFSEYCTCYPPPPPKQFNPSSPYPPLISHSSIPSIPLCFLFHLLCNTILKGRKNPCISFHEYSRIRYSPLSKGRNVKWKLNKYYLLFMKWLSSFSLLRKQVYCAFCRQARVTLHISINKYIYYFR